VCLLLFSYETFELEKQNLSDNALTEPLKLNISIRAITPFLKQAFNQAKDYLLKSPVYRFPSSVMRFYNFGQIVPSNRKNLAGLMINEIGYKSKFSQAARRISA